MRKPVVLITGANGEIGHALAANLAKVRTQAVVALDLNPLDARIARLVHREITGSILDNSLLERILAEFEVDLIFHLAALLSTRAEFTPMAAHHVNVEGTLNLLEFAARESESHGRPVVFVYPSSIAAYGLPDAGTRQKAGRVREDDWNKPITMP
jgi:nucleoside-diphosphate-sugar epimerase